MHGLVAFNFAGLFGSIGKALVDVVLPTIAAAAGGALVALIRKLTKKAGVELTAAQAEALEKQIVDAIMATEEVARRNPDMTSEEKARATLAAAADAAPHLDGAALQQLVDQALPVVRARLAATAKGLTEPPLSS